MRENWENVQKWPSPPLVGARKNWLENPLIRTGNLRGKVDNTRGIELRASNQRFPTILCVEFPPTTP